MVCTVPTGGCEVAYSVVCGLWLSDLDGGYGEVPYDESLRRAHELQRFLTRSLGRLIQETRSCGRCTARPTSHCAISEAQTLIISTR